MVTDEERDYMYQALRRRSADADQRRHPPPAGAADGEQPPPHRAAQRLLFSLPGTPVIYYGDEIGMGDNIYLGDRNGVRTPMQWTGDRNGGFSRADPARLYAPPIMDPVYGFAAVNVEAQERSPFSLLNWMKRMIALRKQHNVFGRGTIEFLPAHNRKVLAFVRRYDDETVLCVANLSRTVQPVELDLCAFPRHDAGRDARPDRVSAHRRLPLLPEPRRRTPSTGSGCSVPTAPITERVVAGTATSVTELPALMVGAVWETLLDGNVRTLIERELLASVPAAAALVPGTAAARGALRRLGAAAPRTEPLFLAVVEVEFDEAADDGPLPPRLYLPLSLASGETARTVQERVPHAVLATVTGARKGVMFDAWHDDRFAGALLEAVSAGVADADAARGPAAGADRGHSAAAARLRHAAGRAAGRREERRRRSATATG